ncbi:MAG TPA: hypothetical protein VI653_03550, partial [Steroidobacteraceae bacterium]
RESCKGAGASAGPKWDFFIVLFRLGNEIRGHAGRARAGCESKGDRRPEVRVREGARGAGSGSRTEQGAVHQNGPGKRNMDGQ